MAVHDLRISARTTPDSLQTNRLPGRTSAVPARNAAASSAASASGNTQGKLDYDTLIIMLLEDVAMIVRRHGSWYGSNMAGGAAVPCLTNSDGGGCSSAARVHDPNPSSLARLFMGHRCRFQPLALANLIVGAAGTVVRSTTRIL